MSGARIYIGRLNYEVRESHLERFFKDFGRIREILLKNGFGFVEFEDYRDAEDAVYEMNGKELMGERVTIEHARGSPRGNDSYGGGGGRSSRGGYRNNPMQNRRRQGGPRDKYGPPTRTEYRVTVENLSSRVSWQDLKDYMRQAGEVTYADAHKQRRNEGVVEFASYSDMKNAIDKLDDTDLNGRRVRLVEDKSRGRSRRSRTRSRSPRSRSRSRRSSRSKTRSESKSRSRSRSKSRSKSPRHSTQRSRSRSLSKDRKDSKSRSRSRSVEKRSRSKSIEKDHSPRNDSKSDLSMEDKD